jgi:hypothetical protein
VTNHNVENYRVKRKEDHVLVVSEVTTQHIKVHKHVKYSYHICGDTGHKIINCPKYNDMHNMFKNKGMKTTEKPSMVEPKVANPLVHIVDVNMAITRSKVTEKQVFKDRKLIKKNFATN